MSMSLSRVPTELLQTILVFALDDNTCPATILCVSRELLQLGQPLLHGQLRFRSINQLILFAKGNAPLACAPRSIAIALAGGAADFEVFKHLRSTLQRCQRSRMIALGAGSPTAHVNKDTETAQLTLDLLSLRLHSHSSNPHVEYIYEALSLANPKTFVWRGPDPERHFSTANIVPTATYHLICAIATWTIIEHITLTNMSFPSDELGVNTPFSRDAPLLPALPTLRTLYIGQATLLPPSSIAAMVAHAQVALECVRLVDTYRHSIWGNRIRLRDVEDAVRQLRTIGVEQRAEALKRVRKVVRCEKKTERTHAGGDNGDAVGVLT